LVSHEEVVHAITVAKLAQCLPKDKLGSIIEASLKTHEKFTEQDLLGAVPPRDLVEYVALDYLWEKVVTPLIAEAHGYAPKPVVLLAGSKVADVKGVDSAEGDWGSRNTNPPANPAPTASDEVVSEDEILESELTEEDLTSGTANLKVAAADGKKATAR
jgi:hypothetical protein